MDRGNAAPARTSTANTCALDRHALKRDTVAFNTCPGSPQVRRKAIALLTVREIFDLVRDVLVLVEEELTRQSAAAFPPVSEITSYLLGGGGKRLRPALLLLCNAYTGQRSPGAIRLAAV